MASPEFQWSDYDVSLSPELARHMQAFIKARPGARELGMAAAPVAATVPLPDLSAFPTARDKAQILLESAAEVEHALLAQYLYAAYSLKTKRDVSDPAQKKVLDDASDRSWPQTLLAIAREEMGHLMTVQNLLILLGSSPNLEREDFPPRKDLYPFKLHLEPLTRMSLAKYVVAEAPADATDIDDIMTLATQSAGSTINHVGILYGLLGVVFSRADQIEPGATGDAGWDAIVRTIANVAHQHQPPAENWHLADDQFRADTADRQANPDDWEVGQLRVHRVADRAAGLDAIRDIAEQGEGPSSGGATSHFERFLRILEGGDGQDAFPEPSSWVPTRAVPTDPKPADMTNPRTRGWAELADARYALLLGFISHYLVAPGQIRQLFTGWIVAEMRSRLGFIARELTSMPVSAEPGSDDRAAIPFTLPDELRMPDDEPARWHIHRDRTTAAIAIAQQLQAGETDDSRHEFLTDLMASDQARLATMNNPPTSTVTTSFTRDIQPLFRPKDIDHMRNFDLDLAKLDEVRAAAADIVDRVETNNLQNQMPKPPDPHWTLTPIQLLRQWIDDGTPQ
jgi:ferritin-like protein